MERIQSAIEKARARRGQTVVKQPDQAVDSSPLEPMTTPEPERRTKAQESTAPVPQLVGSTRAFNPAEEPPRPERSPPAPQESQHAGIPPSQNAIDLAWMQLTPCSLDAPRLIRKRILTLQSGVDAVQFDQLRTKVLQTMRASQWQRLAITSPLPSSGKSTLALNLALSLSRQPDLRTVLLEMDLRRPSLAGLLGVKPHAGIAAWLEGRTQFSDHAMCWNHNLAILTSTAPVHDTAELLASRQTADALSRMEAQYAPDIVIFDMPPILVGDDVMAFTAQIDAALIVAAAEESTIKQIDSCETELARATNVMGVILNKCQNMGESKNYGYYYG